MPKLISRDRQIPNGFRYYIPQLKWQSRPFDSFDTIVTNALQVMKANPHVAQRMGWVLTYEAVANQVDYFNAALCQANGWHQYITQGGGGAPSVPFPQVQNPIQPVQPSQPFQPGNLFRSLKNVVAGGNTIIEWIKSGAEAVPAELAEKRAAVCVSCPKNAQGDLTSFFTVPASNAIRAALNSRKEMNLSTTQDDKLGICSACSCPLPLKLHLKLESILPKMPKESFDALAENCWIRTESK